MNVFQTHTAEKGFLRSRRGLNPQPPDDRRDDLIIEPPKLRWWAKVQVEHMCDICGSHDIY